MAPSASLQCRTAVCMCSSVLSTEVKGNTPTKTPWRDGTASSVSNGRAWIFCEVPVISSRQTRPCRGFDTRVCGLALFPLLVPRESPCRTRQSRQQSPQRTLSPHATVCGSRNVAHRIADGRCQRVERQHRCLRPRARVWISRVETLRRRVDRGVTRVW